MATLDYSKPTPPPLDAAAAASLFSTILSVIAIVAICILFGGVGRLTAGVMMLYAIYALILLALVFALAAVGVSKGRRGGLALTLALVVAAILVGGRYLLRM